VANVAYDPIASGTTRLSLEKKPPGLLKQNGVKLSGKEGATLKKRRRLLPGLLMLESVPVTGALPYRAVREVLDRYLDQSVKAYRPPRFFLNDIVRYWRTGQEFEVERLGADEYRLTRVAPSNEGGWSTGCPPARRRATSSRSTPSRPTRCEAPRGCNVLSEATKPDPDPRVVEWLRANERSLVVDPVILGEVRLGILPLDPGARRSELERWFEVGIARIHCLPWDSSVGLRWAELLADLRRRGRPMSIKDSLIAASALAHDLALATLNRPDFEPAEVKLVDPLA
jgi:predicted nucleic acid-binding protein